MDREEFRRMIEEAIRTGRPAVFRGGPPDFIFLSDRGVLFLDEVAELGLTTIEKYLELAARRIEEE